MFNNFRLKRVTYNLGSPIETEDDITCAVDNTKLMNRLLKNNNHLMLKSKNDPKDITYVISDMEFPDHFRLTTDDNVIFINCTFNKEVFIDRANKVSFTNNKYIVPNNNFIYSDRFFVIDNTNIVRFISDNFINSADLPFNYDMKVRANQILVQGSNIFENSEGHLFFDCDKFECRKNSNISLRTGKIKTNHLVIDAYSNIDVSKRIMIDTPRAVGLSNIKSDDMIVNGVRVNNIDTIEIKKNPRVKIKKSK